MKTSLTRIYTEDGLELHGVLYEPEEKTQTILIHVHGMAGNFYENQFLNSLAQALTKNKIAFFVFNNRGSEFIKDFHKTSLDGSSRIVRLGSAYEAFEDSYIDIKAAIDFISKKFEYIHISGHSLGCAKVAYYVATSEDKKIASALFISPSDMLGLVRADQENFKATIIEATTLVKSGKNSQLLTELVWGEYPISASTYLSLFADDAKDAIFNFSNPSDMLDILKKISVPLFAIMGTKDDALTVPIQEAFTRLEEALIRSPKKQTRVLEGATHGYRGHEEELAGLVLEWLTSEGN